MAKATRKRGFEYFVVADHSKSAHYAGGLSVEEIAQQHREADRLNKRFGKDFRILKGIESDILADGSLDYEDYVLERFDFVVASIHGRFKLDRKAQTQRLLRAIYNPHTTIIGHMTGRQLQRRPCARDRSRNASPPLGSRSLPPTASAWSAHLFGVDQMVRSMMGSGEARSSKLTARAETHRDRNGLTFPTSSAEQMATPERSLSRVRS
ncbi:histidinol phosphatase-like PHP family hydrolase [Bradyrhizobium japonicum]